MLYESRFSIPIYFDPNSNFFFFLRLSLLILFMSSLGLLLSLVAISRHRIHNMTFFTDNFLEGAYTISAKMRCTVPFSPCLVQRRKPTTFRYYIICFLIRDKPVFLFTPVENQSPNIPYNFIYIKEKKGEKNKSRAIPIIYVFPACFLCIQRIPVTSCCCSIPTSFFDPTESESDSESESILAQKSERSLPAQE